VKLEGLEKIAIEKMTTGKDEKRARFISRWMWFTHISCTAGWKT